MGGFCLLMASIHDASASPTTRTPSIQRFVSMNDDGQVAFVGSITDDSSNIVQNIYTFDSAMPGQLSILMNTNLELTDRGISAPSQEFSAPMIKNNGNVVAWRYLGVLVGIGSSSGPLYPVALTYVEEWPFAGASAPNLDLPVEQVAMGNGDVAEYYPVLVCVDPVSGFEFPSAYDTNSSWEIVYGLGNSLPAQNNNGLVAFCGQDTNGQLCLTTSEVQAPAQSFLLPSGNLAFPRVSDNGMVVATINDGTNTTLTLFTDETNLNTPSILAGPDTGFASIGLSPCINDAGTIIAFYGDYEGSDPALTNGPGVFAAINTGGTWTLVSIASTSDDTNFDSNLDVNNTGQIVFKATNSSGSLALFATSVSQTAPFQVVPATILQSVGDTSPYGIISDLEFYAGLANTGDVAYWIQTDVGHVIEKTINTNPPQVLTYITGVNGAPLQPPQSGQFQFQVFTDPSLHQVVVQSSPDLMTWTDLATLSLANGTALCTDSNVSIKGMKCYRVKP